MRSMRAFLAEFNVYRWAGRMLVDAARLRSRDRLTGRLTDHLRRRRCTMRDILSRAGREVLQQFAWSNVLLAFDYDGTLAPIVRDPNKAAMRATHAAAAGGGRDSLSLHRRLRPRAGRRPALAARDPAAAGGRQPRDRALAGHAAAHGRGRALGAPARPASRRASRACGSRTRRSRSPSTTGARARRRRRAPPSWRRPRPSARCGSSEASRSSTSSPGTPRTRAWHWRESAIGCAATPRSTWATTRRTRTSSGSISPAGS